METKKIELTLEEINLIKNALYFVYDKKLDTINKGNKILSKEEKETMVFYANKYFDLTDKF